MADLIRYDLLAQEALRGVVRRVLIDVARDGLPGDHHLYIAFDTRRPGVRLSTRMRERYPEEMTVVLQHQFWDLNVTEHSFEVGLSFGGVPERLLVPFSAMKGFFDPSVQFGLQFEAEDDEEAKSETPAKQGGKAKPGELRTAPLAVAPAQPTEVPAGIETVPRRKPRTVPAMPAPADTARETVSQENLSKPAAAKEAGAKEPAKPAPAKEQPAADTPPSEAPRSAEIVSIDKFRKK